VEAEGTQHDQGAAKDPEETAEEILIEQDLPFERKTNFLLCPFLQKI
jgi:hypothetical protein